MLPAPNERGDAMPITNTPPRSYNQLPLDTPLAHALRSRRCCHPGAPTSARKRRPAPGAAHGLPRGHLGAGGHGGLAAARGARGGRGLRRLGLAGGHRRRQLRGLGARRALAQQAERVPLELQLGRQPAAATLCEGHMWPCTVPRRHRRRPRLLPAAPAAPRRAHRSQLKCVSLELSRRC